jgi:hypothetical protein
MNPLSYPLQQLFEIKKNRFDQAIKLLEEKKAILEKAYEKLFDLTTLRDETLEHKNAKLQQLRDELDQGTTTDKIQQMKSYLTIVEEKLAERQKKVTQQQIVVDAAQKQVDLATDELFQRKKDLEKLEIHKKEWEAEVHYWTEQKESLEHDEQGTSLHTLRQQEKKRKER